MRHFFRTACFILLFSFASVSDADIYQYVDSEGVYHFTNTPPDTKKYKKILKETRNASPETYRHIIYKTSHKYDVAPELVNAVIKAESNWDPNAVSKKGAMGLMQLMPETAEEMNVQDPFNPSENIIGGVRYLRFLLDKFNGELNLALAAYNAGPHKVEKFGAIPPIPETRKYVRNILSMYKKENPKKITPIYKMKFDDGTTLYTNTPEHYGSALLSKF